MIQWLLPSYHRITDINSVFTLILSRLLSHCGLKGAIDFMVTLTEFTMRRKEIEFTHQRFVFPFSLTIAGYLRM